MARRSVVIVEGSPRRKGNTALLAGQVAEGARESGAAVTSFYLHGLDIGACSACDACQESLEHECSLDDDMALLYPALRQADALVVATPVYWYSVSAQTKLFLDRLTALTCFGDSDEAGGSGWEVESHLEKTEVGLLLAYAGRDAYRSGAANAIHTLCDGFTAMRACVVGMVYGRADAAGAIAYDPAMMAEAKGLGRRLGHGGQ